MTRPVRFGLWYDFRNPPEWRIPFGDMYRTYLDQIVAAEKQGFDSVWLTEHHFCDDGYTPSPFVIASAIGARTEKMHIGFNLMILPLHDPIRIAEDAATLSLLTGGRFDLGVGLGYRQLEFDAFNRNLKNRPSLMEESIEIIRRAWAGETINFTGKRFVVGDHKITPQPEKRPRILMGGMSEPAIDRVARIGDGFLSTGGIGEDMYIDALARHGKDPKEGCIVAGSWALISPDPVAEAKRVAPHVLYQSNKYIEWGAFGPPETTPLYKDAAQALTEGLYTLWTAEQAIESIAALLDKFPQMEDIHFWAQLPGEPIEQGQARIDYIASEVLPALRKMGYDAP